MLRRYLQFQLPDTYAKRLYVDNRTARTVIIAVECYVSMLLRRYCIRMVGEGISLS